MSNKRRTVVIRENNIEWLNNQNNANESINMAITFMIKHFGTGDVFENIIKEVIKSDDSISLSEMSELLETVIKPKRRKRKNNQARTPKKVVNEDNIEDNIEDTPTKEQTIVKAQVIEEPVFESEIDELIYRYNQHEPLLPEEIQQVRMYLAEQEKNKETTVIKEKKTQSTPIMNDIVEDNTPDEVPIKRKTRGLGKYTRKN